jgi:hypothetical protein
LGCFQEVTPFFNHSTPGSSGCTQIIDQAPPLVFSLIDQLFNVIHPKTLKRRQNGSDNPRKRLTPGDRERQIVTGAVTFFQSMG